jgi:hypothetical protein
LPAHIGPLLDPLAEGRGFTVNVAPLVAVPLGVVTATVPVVPVPMVAIIWLPLLDTIAAAVPPIETAVAPEKKLPLIVIEVPTHPLEEPKPEITGAGSE